MQNLCLEMAVTKKETISFLIGESEEEDDPVKPTGQKPSNRSTAQWGIFDFSNALEDNVRDVNFMETWEEENKRRRQSEVCIPTSHIPTRGTTTTCGRNRHCSDNDSLSRRFVLNPLSKVPLEVRRHYSGFFHILRKGIH